MIEWKKQGEAVVGGVPLLGGMIGNAVIVGGRNNPKGAVLIVPGEDGGDAETITLNDGYAVLGPGELIEILGMQERLHGSSGLPKPAGL